MPRFKYCPTSNNAYRTRASKKSPGTHVDSHIKSKRRLKPGAGAIKEIRKYQKSTDLLASRAPFKCLVKSTPTDGTNDGDQRYARDAVSALQTSTEALCTELFEESQLFATHAKRVGVQPKDLQLAILLRNRKSVL